jgi:hypothetical protein
MELTVHGARSVRRTVDEIGERAMHPRPALDDVADLIFKANRQLWNSDGYGRWPNPNRDGRIMRKSGDLERALTRRGASSAALEIDRDEVFVGIPAGRSPIYYGRFHDQGRGVPQRAVTADQRRVRREADEIIARWLVGR